MALRFFEMLSLADDNLYHHLISGMSILLQKLTAEDYQTLLESKRFQHLEEVDLEIRERM